MVRCGSAALAVSAFLLPGWASSTPPVNCGARLLMFDDFDSLHLLAWRGEPGGNTTVLLEPRYPWEADVHSEGTVLYDSVAAEYRAYYVSQPEGAGNQILGRLLTVATSPDGVAWTRPMLPLVPWANFTHTNILLKNKGAAEISQVSVFLNANTTAGAGKSRYEMFFLSKDVPPIFAAEPTRFPASVTEPCTATRLITTAYSGVECTYRMGSPDGFDWSPLEIVGNMMDGSSGSFVYRGGGGSYSAFIQLGLPAPPGAFVPWDVGAGHQRMIVRAVSNATANSGTHSGGAGTWGAPAFVAQPDWRDGQGDQMVGLYAGDSDGDGSGGVGGVADSGSGADRFAACSFAGARVQVGVVGMFHALSQTIDNQLALSADDGRSWWRPVRRPNVPLAPLGDWGSGLIWPFRSLVTDARDNSTLHMFYSGTEGLHGDLFSTMPAEVLARGQRAAGFDGAGGGTWSYSPIRSYPGLAGGEGGADYEPMSFARTSIWFVGAMMRSSWSRGRLHALVPAAGGSHAGVAVTKPIVITTIGGGGQPAAIVLRVNAVTVGKGSVAAELINWSCTNTSQLPDVATAAPMPGFSLAECRTFQGDAQHGVVTWGSGGALPAGVSAVRVRLVLLRARVFGMSLELE